MAKLPSSTCGVVDRLIRNFIWGRNEDKEKLHLVKWSNICQPKKRGLGLRASQPFNEALLVKLR
ncbi:hypothetical protein RCOM_0834200 [Ricinus communis]|uniref:Reverse transcriptase zinc-binding domain-containing protein n=1 Tax=Ricinus communis TaxID=3988 RepID=B9SM32_RICCO|nr:hypothetical protein RCOM_0834200 [Ricinus communis]